jgi:hypothetical protein
MKLMEFIEIMNYLLEIGFLTALILAVSKGASLSLILASGIILLYLRIGNMKFKISKRK